MTMEDAELREVIRRAQEGEAAAFARLYEQYHRRVFGLCRKILGTEDAAEDATSEVFERLHRVLDHYDIERPFSRWLLTLASNHCLNRLRRRHLERRLFAEEPSDAPAEVSSSSPLVACESQQERRALLQALETLPESYRLPLVLKYYGDLSYDEIAEQIGKDRNHVAVLLHRGKQALRRNLDARPKEAR